MMARYFSDLCPAAWTFARQEALLGARMPGYPAGEAYSDAIGRRRWTAGPAALTARAALLKGLRPGETLYVASLAVLAFSEDDLRLVLRALAAEGVDLVSAETGHRLSHGASMALRQAVVQEFLSTRKVASNAGRRMGAEASLAARTADIAQRLDLMRKDWSNPDVSTASLLLRGGRQKKGTAIVIPMSYNTATAHLGHRPDALRKAKATKTPARCRPSPAAQNS